MKNIIVFMNSSNVSNLAVLLLPIIGGFIGYFIKYFLDRQKDFTSEIDRERRKHYQDFIDLIINLFETTKNKADETIPLDFQSKLYNFYKKYMLYASPNVINNFSNLFQYIYTQEGEGNELNSREILTKLSKVIKAMRSDLGLSNKGLGKNGENIFKAIIKGS